MKIGIVGSREFSSIEQNERMKIEDFVCAIVNSFFDSDFAQRQQKYGAIEDILVSGGAEGIDTFAEDAADLRGIKKIIIRPDFEVKGTPYNKSDYYKRNKKIVEESDVLIMFWDKISPGTKLCLQALLEAIKNGGNK